LIKLIVWVSQQDKTILPSGSKEHPLMFLPLMFIFWFSFSSILSTDVGGDISATIICACLSFFLAKVNSQGLRSNIWRQTLLHELWHTYRDMFWFTWHNPLVSSKCAYV
jgi:hypothetical protein